MYGSGALLLWLTCPVLGVRLALYVPMLLQFLMGIFPPLGVVVGESEVFSGKLFYGVRTVGGIEGFYAAGGLRADRIHWREAARAFEQVLSPRIVFKAFRGEHFHHRGYYVEVLGAVRLSAAETRLFNRPAGEYYRHRRGFRIGHILPFGQGARGVVACDYYEGVRVFFLTCARKPADFPVRIPHMV